MRPDFSRMGSVALVGAFTGIDIWQPGADMDFGGTAGGVLVGKNAWTTNGGGEVRAACVLGGWMYIGGQFDSLVGNGTGEGYQGVAVWDGTALRALGRGIAGSVRTLFCDDASQTVFVGGDFEAPVGQGDAYRGNVAVWDVRAGEWKAPGFGGLDGAVDVISRGGHGEVLFGGDFTTALAMGNATNVTNTTEPPIYLNTTSSSLPSAPIGTLGTNDSSYLAPISLLTPLSAIDAGPSTDDPRHRDPRQLLCAGGDGWWVRDASVGKVTVNLYRSVSARGVRLGNTGGARGTTRFRIITIPDNTVRTLTYTDPETLRETSCTESCPLALDASIAAQDFLFSSTQDITGFQVYLEGWTGDGAGLNLMQLLSDGAGSTSSVEAENSAVCTGAGNGTARVQTTGQTSDWVVVETETMISGTVRKVLTTTISDSATDRPSITYYPFIASTGFYQLYLTTPGCAALPPCDARTRNVQVEVFPSRGALPVVVDLDQTNTDEARVLVYEGFVERSSEAFGMTVRLALAAAPVSSGGGQWTLVGSEVDARWEAAAVNGTRAQGSASGVTTISSSTADGIVKSGNTTASAGVRSGFGVYAWVNGTMTSDATALIPPTGQTSFDALAYALSSARNASSVGDGWAVYAFGTVDNVTYVGGNFTTANYSNVVALDSRGTVRPLAARGPNGAVRALAGYGSTLFVGGEFTGLANQDLASSYLAQYDTKTSQWAPLAGGVDGIVRGLQVNGTDLLVWGDFTTIIFANGTSLSSGGVASYDLGAGTWSRANVGGRRVWGSISDVAEGVVVGRITAVSEHGASGLVTLSGDGSDQLTVNGAGVGFASNASHSATQKRDLLANLTLRPHAHATRGHSSSSWVDYFSSPVRKRQAAPSISPATDRTYTAPSIVTVAYYTNATSKDPWVIIGGNFSTLDASASNLGIWDAGRGSIVPVVASRSAADVVGSVVALEVVNEGNQGWLFVGGTGGFGWTDMKAQGGAGEWKNVPALSNGSTSNASAGSVLAITHRSTFGSNSSNNEQVIVAGAFTTAGSLGCVGICSWDPEDNRWSTLGSGLRSGVVTTMQSGGKNGEMLVVGGSFALSDGTSAVAAVYSFSNASWTALGSANDLPGSVDALTMDDENVASVWAGGRSRNGGAPFVAHWDGNKWTDQTSSLGENTRISQLAFVPLAEKHNANGSIESDRLLLATGLVRVPVQDSDGSSRLVNSTAALFDGQTWTPLLTGVQQDGSSGSASGLFYSQHSFDFRTKHYLALGLIVLIAIAISTGLVFLIALIGLLVMFCWRPRESSHPAPAGALARKNSNSSSDYEDTTAGASEQDRLRKLGAIQAAIFGEKAAAAAGFLTPGVATRDANHATLASQPPRSDHSRRSSYGETLEHRGNPVVLASPIQTDESAPTHMGRPTTVKYAFVGEDQRELSVKAGDPIHVLEEDEGEQWWFVRTQDGREGVVPAAYVW